MAIRLQGNDWAEFTINYAKKAKVKGYYESTNNNICLFIKFNGKPYKHWCSLKEKQVYLTSALTQDSVKCLDKFGQSFCKLDQPVLIQDIFKFKLPLYQKAAGVTVTEKQEKALFIINKYLKNIEMPYFCSNEQVINFIGQYLKLVNKERSNLNELCI